MFHGASRRPDHTWKIINDAPGMRRNPTDVREIAVDGAILSNTSLFEHFNKHFITTIADTVLPSAEPCTLDFKAQETLLLRPTDYNEVHRPLLSLESCKATDADNVQTRLVKYVLDYIYPCVVHILNLSFESVVFP